LFIKRNFRPTEDSALKTQKNKSKNIAQKLGEENEFIKPGVDRSTTVSLMLLTRKIHIKIYIFRVEAKITGA